MSPAGLHDYMEGAKGLCNLGRGHDVVLSFLEEMPAVVQECGEDIIRDCVEAALKLSSMTSGQVIALLFASLPTAARRLGDPELLRGYLALIHQLLQCLEDELGKLFLHCEGIYLNYFNRLPGLPAPLAGHYPYKCPPWLVTRRRGLARVGVQGRGRD